MSSSSTALRLWPVICGAYLVLMFVGTHLPMRMIGPPLHQHDVIVHFAAYGGLGALIGWRVAHSRGWFGWVATAWAAILLWALLDESTQPLVGRALELKDWLADALGSAVGLTAGVCVRVARSPEPVSLPTPVAE